jgi:nucleotide-binding universal stress UspA family protein
MPAGGGVPSAVAREEVMSILVAVTDSPEGKAALEAAANEATQLNVPLTAVNLTGADIDVSQLAAGVPVEVVVPTGGSDVDEVEQVLQAIEERSEVTRLVVGVRKRSPIGKAVLGSIAQRLILEASVPVLSVKTTDAETRS